MREPWEAAEILEEIVRNADIHSSRKRMVDSMTGKVKSLGPVAMHTHFSSFLPPSFLEVEYHYFVSAIMQDINGDVQEVVDLLKTGLKEGQRVWLGDSDQANEKELVIRMKYTDVNTLDRYRANMRWE
jgi:hypothetical protein